MTKRVKMGFQMKLFLRASIAIALFLMPVLAFGQVGPTRGTTTTTGTGATTILSASGSSTLKTYVTDIECWRNDAGTSSVSLTFNDSASTVLILPSGGTELFHSFITPIVTAANTAFTVTASSSTTTIGCSAQGNYAP